MEPGLFEDGAEKAEAEEASRMVRVRWSGFGTRRWKTRGDLVHIIIVAQLVTEYNMFL